MTRLNLPANVETTRSEAGKFFRLIDATGTVFAKFTDQGQPFPLTKGMSVRLPLGFTDIVFETDTAQTIEYVVMAEGELTDDSFIPGAGASLSTIQGTETYGASSSVSLANAAATSIVAAASGRKGVVIYNPSGSTVYLHNTAVTGLSAIGIPPGGALILRSTQAWFGYQTSGAAFDVYVSEIT